MIEVEKKFRLNEEEMQRLLVGAVFVSEKTFTDVCYDGPNHSLTTKDIWLRKRGEKFDIKLPLTKAGKQIFDQYEEIVGEEGVRKVLKLEKNGTMEEDLAAAGYAPVVRPTTTRRKYKLGEFGIDVDRVVYKDSDFTYNLCEIELMVEKKEEVVRAQEKITAFANERTLPIRAVFGKAVAFFKENRPEHFDALVKAGVIGPDYAKL